MKRKATTHEIEPRGTFAYRGYLVLRNAIRDTWGVTKDGAWIGSAKDAKEAQRIIDQLLD